MHHQLTHNKTYAHRLPPTLIEQARYWANFHEQGVFTDTTIGGIGNSALQTLICRYQYLTTITVVPGRTVLKSIISSLERIDYDGDPLQFLLESTTYQPFISLFKQTEMDKSDPTLHGIRACNHDYICLPCHVIARLQPTIRQLLLLSCAAAHFLTIGTFCASSLRTGLIVTSVPSTFLATRPTSL